jgi:Protein of unknown function (DUF2852)
MSSIASPPWYHDRDGWGGGLPPWVQALDHKPVWIALMILGFITWWPLGLGILLFLFGSGRMGCGFRRRYGAHRHWASWCGNMSNAHREPSSGNRAFDEYRAETLRGLEEEQREFAKFLDRLRFAKDKAEFDEFMAHRRRPPEGGIEV